jgi:hypothetical protein
VTEADWIRWTGVIVGVFGAIVVAPNGALLILLDAWEAILAVWAAIWKAWNRLVRRKKQPAPAVYAKAGLAAAGGIAAAASVVRNHGAPREVQIRKLWDEVDRLDGRINQAETENRTLLDSLNARIEQESADRRAQREAEEARRRRDERRAARINARGLPLIGLGLVMTGVPDGLAMWPWVGELFITAAALLVLVVALWPFSRWMATQLSQGGKR